MHVVKLYRKLNSSLISRKIAFVIFALFLIVGIFAGYYLENNRINLVIDADIKGGRNFEVYINRDWSNPMRQLIRPGRYVYVFENIPGRLESLRLDPTDVANAEITIYNVEFQQRVKPLLKFHPREIGEWIAHDLSFKAIDSDKSIKLISTNNDPILQHDLKVVFAPGILSNLMLKIYRQSHIFDFICLITLWCIFVLFYRQNHSFWKSSYLIVIVLCVYLIARFVITTVIKAGGNIPEVYSTVGLASYTGLAKEADLYAYWLGILSIGVLMISSAFIWKKLEQKFSKLGGDTDIISSKSEFSMLFFIGIVAVFAVVTFPNLNGVYESVGRVTHNTQYDYQNIVTWHYFRYLGLIPFKDFWYPYGGFYYMATPFPPDSIYVWLHNLLVFTVCAFSIYSLLNFSKMRSFSVLLFMLWLHFNGMMATNYRYYLSLSLILFFTACLESRRLMLFLFLGIYTFHVFFMEASQLLYAVPGCILIFLASLFINKDQDRKLIMLRYSTLSAFVATSSICIYLVYLKELKALPEYLMFYRTIGDMAKYGMWPTAIVEWLRNPSSMDGLFFTLTMGLFALSLWYVLSKNVDKTIHDFVPLAIALLTLVIFQKQIIRPHIADQAISVVAVGFTIMAARLEFKGLRGGILSKCILGLLTGVVITLCIFVNGTADKFWQQYTKRLFTAPKNIKMALMGESVWYGAKNSYFDPMSFPMDGMGGKELTEKLIEKMSFEKDDDLFVLGDDSYLYILLQKQTPFYITFYNQSILNSQMNTVKWIDNHKPQYVIWRYDFREFDQIPNIVRVPLLFEKIISEYVYADQLGPFIILQRKKPEQIISVDFWRKYLGDTVDLCFIPSRSNPLKLEEGGGTASNRFTLLTAYVQNPAHGKTREVSLEISEQIYKIKFRERKDVQFYNIILNRIWFWQLAQRHNMEPKIYLNQDPSMMIETKEVNLKKNMLY